MCYFPTVPALHAAKRREMQTFGANLEQNKCSFYLSYFFSKEDIIKNSFAVFQKYYVSLSYSVKDSQHSLHIG